MRYKRFCTMLTMVFFILMCACTVHAFERKVAPQQRKVPKGVPGKSSSPKLAPITIACPATLNNVKITIEADPNLSQGWEPMWHPMNYLNLTLQCVLHNVDPNNGKLTCTYARTSTGLRLMTIVKDIPAGRTCTAIGGYRFSCTP